MWMEGSLWQTCFQGTHQLRVFTSIGVFVNKWLSSEKLVTGYFSSQYVPILLLHAKYAKSASKLFALSFLIFTGHIFCISFPVASSWMVSDVYIYVCGNCSLAQYIHLQSYQIPCILAYRSLFFNQNFNPKMQVWPVRPRLQKYCHLCTPVKQESLYQGKKRSAINFFSTIL